MQPSTLRILPGFIFLLLASAQCFAQSAILSSPTLGSNQLRFNLEGDAYRHYVIQGSSNLMNWVSLATNVSSTATRPLNFPETNGYNFYRSALFSRTNSLGKAIQLIEQLDLRGNVFTVDSFDSRDPFFSTYGQYDPQKSKDAAELSLDQGLIDSLDIATARIHGTVATGPGMPVEIGPFGTIGDFVWIMNTNYGIQCDKLSTDINPYFGIKELTNSLSAPFRNLWVTNSYISRSYDSTTTSNNPANPTGVVTTNVILTVSTNLPNPSTVFGTIITNLPFPPSPECADNPIYHQTNYVFKRIESYTETIETGRVTNFYVDFYDYIFDTDDYRVSELSGKILIRGNARVWVTDNLDLTGNNENLLIETNASLQLYVSAPDVGIKGLGEINQSGVATNFIYYGLSSNTNLDLSGNANFTGIIYAPQAHVSIGGGGNDIYDFVGAIVAKSLHLNGHWKFHYDEALRELPFP